MGDRKSEVRSQKSEVGKGPARTFQDLIVWQKAHQWVLNIYAHTANFPKSELFGLTSQLRRAAASIPANIAEGFRRYSNVEKARFYNIAQGSLEECRYHLILAHDLNFGDSGNLMKDLEQVSRMLEKYYAGVKKDTHGVKSS